MKFNPDIHHRKSLRFKHYDYRQNGLYFITICCKNRQCLLGNIVDNEMNLNNLGEMVRECWLKIQNYYPQVNLHPFVIMPNHIHGIIEIASNENWGECDSPLHNQSTFNGTSQTIGAMIRGFKAGVTSWARKNKEHYDIWQRNYYEHIIRNEKSYNQIIEYIENNPILWEQDRFYNS